MRLVRRVGVVVVDQMQGGRGRGAVVVDHMEVRVDLQLDC